MKDIRLRFLNAGRHSVQDEGCRFRNKKLDPVTQTLKPDAIIQSRP